jgi:hypothetical protein
MINIKLLSVNLAWKGKRWQIIFAKNKTYEIHNRNNR